MYIFRLTKKNIMSINIASLFDIVLLLLTMRSIMMISKKTVVYFGAPPCSDGKQGSSDGKERSIDNNGRRSHISCVHSNEVMPYGKKYSISSWE